MTQEELYDHIATWGAFVRRHDANIFNAMFKDIDYFLKEDDLNTIISDVAGFFGLDVPEIKTHCETLARLDLETDGMNCSELSYNWQMLRKSGINNRDAFTLCMVHELAHLYLKGRWFMLCRNERWCHELAADYIVGAYSALKGLATGKYKYVVRQLQMTLTHPEGKHRAEAVEFAWGCSFKYMWNDIESSLSCLPVFMYRKQKILNEELKQLTGCIIDENYL